MRIFFSIFVFNELFSFSSLPESGNLRDKLRHHTHVFRLYESATINVFVILPLWFEFSASSYFSKISPLQWRWRLSSASLRDVTYVVMTQSRVCFRLKSTLLCVCACSRSRMLSLIHKDPPARLETWEDLLCVGVKVIISCQ